jgi:transposase
MQFAHIGLKCAKIGLICFGSNEVRCPKYLECRQHLDRPTGRQLAAWLGLVSPQHSSGGKFLMLGISIRGDCYLRTLLIHGARFVIRCGGGSTRAESPANMNMAVTQSRTWLQSVVSRRGTNVAAVALANKNARVIWALLAHDRQLPLLS